MPANMPSKRQYDDLHLDTDQVNTHTFQSEIDETLTLDSDSAVWGTHIPRSRCVCIVDKYELPVPVHHDLGPQRRLQQPLGIFIHFRRRPQHVLPIK